MGPPGLGHGPPEGYDLPVSADGDIAPDAPQGGDRAGDRLAGRYELLRLIGRGGMGEVYAARNEATGRDVAIKMIRAANATTEQNRRFLREAKAATAIRHRNVIDILDVFEDEDGTPVMVMELLTGNTLKQLSARTGQLTLRQTASIFLPVISALRTAHAKGIVHRDLKPDNIFLAEEADGEVVPKVLDFGIAKVIDPTTIAAETQGSQTNTGSILGTPHYMSFEQAMSEKDIDHRADIWALGVMLFEVLTGRRPLEFDNLGQMYTAFLKGEVPSIRDHSADLPDDVAEIIDRCLVKERDGRLDDLKEVLETLKPFADREVAQAVGGLSDEPMPTAAVDGATTGTGTQGAFAATVNKSGRRSRTVLVGALLVAVVGVGAFVGLSPSGEETGSAEAAAALEESSAIVDEVRDDDDDASATGAEAHGATAPPAAPPTATATVKPTAPPVRPVTRPAAKRPPTAQGPAVAPPTATAASV
ncbi:MAG: serine/threonine protein kinase, partial [Deltaproteobacteria bacterium]|nr:serine/threonine protein kinase [Deltaproteobacteria bacterium]MBW2530655.1 serine/threonine protein kinase [Deltaproteobacteria bacterium]